MGDKPKITKSEVARLREVAGKEIVDGNPARAQKIQQLIQGSKVVDDK